jgi:hypothetical protein
MKAEIEVRGIEELKREVRAEVERQLKRLVLA